jgi:hypothetical protein
MFGGRGVEAVARGEELGERQARRGSQGGGQFVVRGTIIHGKDWEGYSRVLDKVVSGAS